MALASFIKELPRVAASGREAATLVVNLQRRLDNKGFVF